MTTPASGPISLSDVGNQTGNYAATANMAWVKSNGKVSVGGGVGGITSMSGLYSKAYYQNNTLGNCNNGNCTNLADPGGNRDVVNCRITGGVNCANCDPTAYLQPNCNCNCTYNCTTTTITTNCNCDCWICACACW